VGRGGRERRVLERSCATFRPRCCGRLWRLRRNITTTSTGMCGWPRRARGVTWRSFVSSPRATRADGLGEQDIERDVARLTLRERGLGGLLDALLGEGDVEGTWSVAHEDPDWNPAYNSACVSPKPARHSDRIRRCPGTCPSWMSCCWRPPPSVYPGHPGAQVGPPRGRSGQPKRVVHNTGRGSSRASSPPPDTYRDARQGRPQLTRQATRPPPGTPRDHSKAFAGPDSGQADARSRTGNLLLTMIPQGSFRVT
jgi:hypothetical protein